MSKDYNIVLPGYVIKISWTTISWQDTVPTWIVKLPNKTKYNHIMIELGGKDTTLSIMFLLLSTRQVQQM